MPKVDENSGYTGMAVNNVTGLAVPLPIDSSTGRLLVKIIATTNTTPEDNRALIDENYESVSQVVDDNAGDIQPLLIDNRNGLLWCDVIT